jgi:hypothetical protein
LLEGGHFALDEAADEIAIRIERFLTAHNIGAGG